MEMLLKSGSSKEKSEKEGLRRQDTSQKLRA